MYKESQMNYNKRLWQKEINKTAFIPYKRSSTYPRSVLNKVVESQRLICTTWLLFFLLNTIFPDPQCTGDLFLFILMKVPSLLSTCRVGMDLIKYLSHPSFPSSFEVKMDWRLVVWHYSIVSFSHKCNTTNSWGAFNAKAMVVPSEVFLLLVFFPWSFVAPTYAQGGRCVCKKRDNLLSKGRTLLKQSSEERLLPPPPSF